VQVAAVAEGDLLHDPLEGEPKDDVVRALLEAVDLLQGIGAGPDPGFLGPCGCLLPLGAILGYEVLLAVVDDFGGSRGTGDGHVVGLLDLFDALRSLLLGNLLLDARHGGLLCQSEL